MSIKSEFLKAFPSFLEGEVVTVLNMVPLTTALSCAQYFVVSIHNESISIPSRVYFENPNLFDEESLSSVQKGILRCMLTRHHDGFIREKNIRKIMPFCNQNTWAIPYVLLPLGEYVIEILQALRDDLELIDKKNLIEFISHNPKFFSAIENRAISYWDCYYRWKFPKREDYVGFQILRYLQDCSAGSLGSRQNHS